MGHWSRALLRKWSKTCRANGAETQTGGLALVIPNAAGRTFIPFSGSVPEIEG